MLILWKKLKKSQQFFIHFINCLNNKQKNMRAVKNMKKNLENLLFDESVQYVKKKFFCMCEESILWSHICLHTHSWHFAEKCFLHDEEWAFYLLKGKNMFAEIFFTNFSFPLGAVWWLHMYSHLSLFFLSIGWKITKKKYTLREMCEERKSLKILN